MSVSNVSRGGRIKKAWQLRIKEIHKQICLSLLYRFAIVDRKNTDRKHPFYLSRIFSLLESAHNRTGKAVERARASRGIRTSVEKEYQVSFANGSR